MYCSWSSFTKNDVLYSVVYTCAPEDTIGPFFFKKISRIKWGVVRGKETTSNHKAINKFGILYWCVHVLDICSKSLVVKHRNI